MRLEPHVDAVDVEAVVAFGEEPGLLAIGELGEADRALEPVLEVAGAVDEDGERSEHGGLEASPESRDGRVLARREDEAAAPASPT